MSWTDDRVELLKRLWAEGLSASQIALRLAEGVTRNAVIGKVHRLCLAGRVTSGQSAAAQEARARKTSPVPAPVSAKSPVSPLLARSGTVGNTALKLDLVPRNAPVLEPTPLRLVDVAKGGRITILHLTEKTCKWPIGDPGNEAFCFCGHTPREGTPYCEYHARIAYQPAHDRNRMRRVG